MDGQGIKQFELRPSAMSEPMIEPVVNQEGVLSDNKTQDSSLAPSGQQSAAVIPPNSSPETVHPNGDASLSTVQENGNTPAPVNGNHVVPNGNAASMPPPAAPASMLYTLQPSSEAKDKDNQLKDEAIVARLIASCVILFRQGKGAEARKLGQYTIDLIGEEVWKPALDEFMKAPPLPDDNEALMPLLQVAAETINHYDQKAAGFLNGMLYIWT